MSLKFCKTDSTLQATLINILETTWSQFPSLAQNQIAVSWVVYQPPYIVNTDGALSPDAFWQQRPLSASYRNVELIYPASVVKLFYLVAIHEWLERGMTQPTLELDRAIRDMIVDSSNDATSYVVDVLTGTTSGPELPAGPFETWQSQRNLINRYFQTLQWPELTTVNINQKTWGDGPYGRERTFLGDDYSNRNMLTTESIARLMHSIMGGVSVTAERSKAMMALMKRDLSTAAQAIDPENNQVTGFLGAGVPESARVWSKAGWTSRVRHDAAYIECEGCHPYLLVVFTDSVELSGNTEILPFISQQVLSAVQASM